MATEAEAPITAEVQVPKKKVICTHNGSFHCDEALACFMLLQTDEFRGAEIVRTRDAAVIEKADVVVDVGGVYDPARHRYDHHQIGFTGTLNDEYKTKLSSAGLVYKHFGMQILRTKYGFNQDHAQLVYYKVYETFIEAIDGIDNGINQYPPDVKPRYRVTTDVSARVSHLNPQWNQPAQNDLTQFHKAMDLVGQEYLDRVNYFASSWLPAREIVERAFAGRFALHPSGQIVLLDTFCPWKDHLYTIEEEQAARDANILYVIFADTTGSWRVQCVGENNGGFQNRLSLPSQWCGHRDNELSEIAQIPGCIFVHINGFIGGNKTKEGAIAMAQKALLQQAS